MGFKTPVRMFSVDPKTNEAKEVHFRPELFNYNDSGVDKQGDFMVGPWARAIRNGGKEARKQDWRGFAPLSEWSKTGSTVPCMARQITSCQKRFRSPEGNRFPEKYGVEFENCVCLGRRRS